MAHRDELRNSRTRTRDGVLIDPIRSSPVDAQVRSYRRWILSGLALILFLVASLVVLRFLHDLPEDHDDPEAHFLHGSIGSEPGGSLVDAVGGVLPPEWIFRALPEICPEKLPGGYASLGLLRSPASDLPIGVSRRQRLGFEQVGLNCASCHTGSYRESPQSERVVVAGMPSHQLDLQGLFRFVLDCTLDERFTSEVVLGKMEAAGARLGPLDRWLYAHVVIPRTREDTRLRFRRLERLMANPDLPDWGPGRVDTFNPYKALQFNWPLDRLPERELIGASDFPALWWQAPREGMQLHWDGNNTSLAERNLSAALGAGVTPATVDHDRLGRVADWIRALEPPPYPFPVDAALARRGEPVYARHCAACHGDHRFREGPPEAALASLEGTRVGTVEPIDRVGTDRHRLDSYTTDFAAAQMGLYPDSEHRFRSFRKTGGYANQPLDGVWARAPYLHNGSVPTLADLLEPPEQRPVAFYRGYDVYDPERLGFVSDVPSEGGRRFFRYDTRLPGNGNGGHLWGTSLAADDKAALVEYMKTF